MFALPLVACCFGYGKFSPNDILQTQKSLFTLAMGVPAFMLIKVLASGFYSKQNIKTPVKVGAAAMVVNSILCALLISSLQHAGLTLASSLAGYFNAGVLLYLLIRHKIYVIQAGWLKFASQLLLANIVIGLYLRMMQHDLMYWYEMHVSMRLATLMMHVLVTVLIYVAVLLLTGFKWQQFRGLGRE